MSTLPYSDIFSELLTAIHNALGYCHIKYKRGELLLETDQGLNRIFEKFSQRKFYNVAQLNDHIIKGLNLKENKRLARNAYPRLTKLVIHAYRQSQKTKTTERYQAEILPSPLSVLYHALTVPSEPQTAAYAFVLCREMLFYFLRLHPWHPELKEISPDFDSFNEEDILNSIHSFNNHSKIQLRWPDNRKTNKSFKTRLDYLNGHILCLKGYTYLWFNNSTQLLQFCRLGSGPSIEKLNKLYCNDLSEDKRYSFRLSGLYISLPDVAEINNWIFGVPIPLRGADLLFYGGLKKSSTTGLVISLNGQPGSGKTSAALSLAAALSPFNTKTIYLSLEESEEDLKTRLNSLVPDYLRKLSIYKNNYWYQRVSKNKEGLTWFTTYKLTENLSIKDLTEFLIELKLRVQNISVQSQHENSTVYIPAVCPMLIVIDNVNELFLNEVKDSTQYDSIERFIDQCRNMGAFVVLVAAEDIPGRSKLDYLVDVAIELRQEGLDRKDEKPIRVLQLLKTRHQVSRQGSHVFHLSSSNGFRISPQVPSQMDKREKIKIELPSGTEFIHTLNLFENSLNGLSFNPLIPIAANSQILVHGHGSSGKAGFGLKILLTPLLDLDPFKDSDVQLGSKVGKSIPLNNQRLNKVLVISFLYPSEYYEYLYSTITKEFTRGFDKYDKRKAMLHVLALYPGFLTPDDFVNKIVRKLEEGRLEGEPYTGILLDGLHNVFLQFKELQESHMVWPLLYSMLYRYSLTVVTTFTNFTLGNNEVSTHPYSTPEDIMLMQQGQKPFLHGLVKAADYFFMLSEFIEGGDRKYKIEIRSSIRTVPPIQSLLWDRERISVQGIITDSDYISPHDI